LKEKIRLFGTDGIRAPFGTYPLDASTVTLLGFRLGELLQNEVDSPTVIMGGDTRESTPEICQWLAAGLQAAGTVAVYGGVLPTPAIATLVLQREADAGIAVSASHNLHPYNGIKIFDRRGFKWSPEAEATLEAMIPGADEPTLPAATDLEVDTSLQQTYLELLRDRVGEQRPFTGLKLVLDTANGAATPFAEPLFASLGAEVIPLGNRPDGVNINADCGSTAPAAMLAAVRSHGADMGIGYDGDADRALIADERGQMRDGDAMLFAWARYLSQKGELEPASIVATSMSNLGLERALEEIGVSVVRCDVGDRTVVTTMHDMGIRLGGEQSGHLVDLQSGTTGDGMGTSLQMAAILKQSGQPLSELLAGFRRFPQVLRNVEVAHKPDLDSLPSVSRAVAEVETRLDNQGRLVLRYSGTEPLARVMIEGPNLQEIETMAGQLIEAIQQDVNDSQK
jgi:phosphoglucosamine mutase